jgi:hypothetical protein
MAQSIKNDVRSKWEQYVSDPTRTVEEHSRDKGKH